MTAGLIPDSPGFCAEVLEFTTDHHISDVSVQCLSIKRTMEALAPLITTIGKRPKERKVLLVFRDSGHINTTGSACGKPPVAL